MSDGLGEWRLLLSAIVGVVVVIGTLRGIRSKWKLGPIGVFLLGGGVSWLLGNALDLLSHPDAAISGFDLTRMPLYRLYWWSSEGIFWLLLFTVLRNVRLETWRRRIVAVLLVSFGSTIYGVASSLLFRSWFSLPFFDPWKQLVGGFSPSWYQGSNLLFSAVQVWIVSAWIGVKEQRFEPSEAVCATGLKGVVMSKLSNQSTRLLCASVLLGHGRARQVLLSWLKDENRGVALELGVDLRLAAQVARFVEKRDRRGWWIYFAMFCASFVLFLISPYLCVLGLIAAAIVWGMRHSEEQNKFAPLFSLQNFDPEAVAHQFPAELEGEDITSLPYSDQNFFVYGGFMPFIGAGGDLGGWSVAIALDKPKENFGSFSRIQTFEIREVYEAIDSALDSLNVEGVEKKDCFFASGTDVRGNPDLLPNIYGRPVQHLEAPVAARYLYHDDEKVRHYRTYRIIDWGGELALSYYIRASRRGNNLFVETRRFVLTPLDYKYRAIDRMVPMEWQEILGTIIAGALVGPIMALASPFWVFGEISRLFHEMTSQEDRHRREQIEKNPQYNYGATTSLRQALSSGVYGHYFQKMDGDLYNKLFEREVLDSLIEFLDARGIDTSDLRERQTTILNTGVMVQGGDVNAESLSVGAGSRAMKKVQGVLASKAEAKGAAA